MATQQPNGLRATLVESKQQEINEYLETTGVNKLLQRYVSRLVEERPSDPCKTLAIWMAKEFNVLDDETTTAPGATSKKLVIEEATKVLADGTKIEADTDASEQLTSDQLSSLLELGLRPTFRLRNAMGCNDPRVQNFSIVVNHAAFNGWVKQPSPCCAASALAGAWNASFGFARPAPYPAAPRVLDSIALANQSPDVPIPKVFPLFHLDALLVMGDILRQKIRALATTVMYALGCQRIDKPAPPSSELERGIHERITATDFDTFGAMVRS